MRKNPEMKTGFPKNKWGKPFLKLGNIFLLKENFIGGDYLQSLILASFKRISDFSFEMTLHPIPSFKMILIFPDIFISVGDSNPNLWIDIDILSNHFGRLAK